MNSHPVPGQAMTEEALLWPVLAAIGKAWWQIRLLHRSADVGALLPPVGLGDATAIDPENILRRVDRIVHGVVFWKFDKRCFYRSFAVATVLRQRGIPAGIDFGLRLSGSRRKQCHCWVTIHGQALGEETEPRQRFPIAAGQWGETVHYWLADDDAEELNP